MTVVMLLLLCSLVLVGGAIVLFVFSAKQGDCHEAERICLLPLDDDERPAGDPSSSNSTHLSPEDSHD